MVTVNESPILVLLKLGQKCEFLLIDMLEKFIKTKAQDTFTPFSLVMFTQFLLVFSHIKFPILVFLCVRWYERA